MRDPEIAGYTRPLNASEDPAEDVATLRDAGASRIVVEDSPLSRARWGRWMAQTQPGDTLLVTSLDRVSGSVVDVVRSLVLLQQGGLRFRCLEVPVFDTWSPDLLSVLTALQEVNHRHMSRVTREGMVGKQPGRPFALDPDGVAMAVELRRAGRTYAHISSVLGVSVNTIQRALARYSA